METNAEKSETNAAPNVVAVASSTDLLALGAALLKGMQDNEPSHGDLLGSGICDFCGEESPQLKLYLRQPVAGACYCRKCAPLSETDEDWVNTERSHGG